MEAQIIKIKCPFCGAVLTAKVHDGMENKVITCLVCKEASPLKDFKRVAEKQEEHTKYVHDDRHKNGTIGILTVLGRGVPPYTLAEGRNIIGRKAGSSSAGIQIETPTNKMSREHLIIDVKEIENRGMAHYVSLYKDGANKTFVNGELLEFGDCIVLKSGDLIKLPDVDIMFEIPDDEATKMA